MTQNTKYRIFNVYTIRHLSYNPTTPKWSKSKLKWILAETIWQEKKKLEQNLSVGIPNSKGKL